MRAFRLVPCALFFALASVACSSSSSSPASPPVAGSVKSSQVNVPHAIAWYGPVASTLTNGVPGTIKGLHVRLSNKEIACGEQHLAGAQILDVAIFDDDVAPRSFPVVPGPQGAKGEEAEVDFDSLDSACNGLVQEPATAGEITVDSVTNPVVPAGPTEITGSVDATFADGHVSGHFDVTVCPDAPPAPQGDAGANGVPCPP